MARGGFVHLRCRSAYSLLEGALQIGELKDLALKHQTPAVGLTDTNNLFGALEFSEKLAEAGVQPIVGITLSVRLAEAELGQARRRPEGSLALLARSEAGYRRLMELSTSAFLDVEPVEAPHVAIEQVLERGDGLLCLTGGPDGVVNALVEAGRDNEALQLLQRLHDAFGDQLYVELQRHGLEREKLVEPFLIDQADERGLPLIATNEPFFATPELHEAHDALMCIAAGTFISVDDRRRVTAQHHFASPDEMRARFADLPEALDNTVDAARRCAFRPLTSAPILPRFTTAKGRDEAGELAAQAKAGLKARLKQVEPAADEKEYWERLDHELGVIAEMGFPGYFLIVADFIKWAKSHGVPVGPGRGSGAGSVVAWALTITDLDPLRFGLLFERFLNPERVSMPDFDIDFCQERRGEVIDYVKAKYGDDRVAQIITFGTLQARAVLRDVGRVMQLPFGLVDRLAKMVPANPANPVTLNQAIEIEPGLKRARKDDPDVARLLKVALQLEGLFRNASTHAAGVVIGDRPLVELVPLYRDPRSPLPATQFNMKWVEPAGLVKFDFLGLKTLTVIDRALAFLKQRGVELELDSVPLDDRATYEMLAAGASIGVFQLKSTGMRDTLKKMRPDQIEDLIALISLYRPGPMKNIDTYVDRKQGREKPEYLHDSLKPILEETYGVIIYQEQVMQIAQVLSGYSLGEADLLRRAMGKKKPEEMAQQRDRFMAGAKTNDVPAGKAGRIFDLVAEFAGYGFNKSHAAAYALIAYHTGYLKANHPVELMAALMSLDINNTDKLAQYVQECRSLQVPVLGPDINASRADFSVEDRAVRYALGAIRNVGLAAMEQVVAEREANGPFKDLFDFGRRVEAKHINKRMVESLARAGAFDGLGVERRQALVAAETVLAAAQSAAAEREAALTSLFGDEPVGGSDRLPGVEPWTATEKLDAEHEAVGFYLSGHPLEDVAEALRRRNVVFSAELAGLAEEGRTSVRVAGIVRRRQERVSAKSGNRFAFLTLSDPTGEFEALVSPELLTRVREIMEPGAAIICPVSLKTDNGDLRLFIDGAEPMEEALRGAFGGMRIHAADAAGLKAVKVRLERLAERPGGDWGEVAVVVRAAGACEVTITLPGSWPVDAGARAAIKAAKGVSLVEEL